MSWPTPQKYAAAVQHPSACFQDADLRLGSVPPGLMGGPESYPGGAAIVFPLRHPSGERWAVKCFTRHVPDLEQRYLAISHHLSGRHLPFLVRFAYFPHGIYLDRAWYPVVKMHWVEGLYLNTFVGQHADNPAVLAQLTQLWLRMADELRVAGLAHGDLQPGNVLLVPGRTDDALRLCLVDYDGMWVPALADRPPGEVGHRHFQHPQRQREGGYDADIDRFAQLVVCTALRCLMVGGSRLWKEYDTGENLLFQDVDFKNPDRSDLFGQLLQSPDPEARYLAWRLQQACRGSLREVPALADVLVDDAPTSLPRWEEFPPPSRPMGEPAVAAAPTESGSVSRFSGRGLLLWSSLGINAILLVGIVLWLMSREANRGGGDKDGGPEAPDQKSRRDGDPAALRLVVAAKVTLRKGGRTRLPVKVERHGYAGPYEIAVVEPGRGGAVEVSVARQGDEAFLEFRTAADASAARGKAVIQARVSGRLVGPSATIEYRVPRVSASSLEQGSEVRCLAFSADGSRLAVGCRDAGIRVWSLPTGKLQFRLTGHAAPVTSMAFGPDGKRLVSSSDDFTLKVWDVEKEWVEFTQKSGGAVRSVAFSPDGRHIASGSDDDALRLWDAKRGGKVLDLFQINSVSVSSVAFSPDGRRIVCGTSGGTLVVLGWSDDKGHADLSLKGHTDVVSGVAYSRDGKRIFSVSRDRTVREWDARTEREPRFLLRLDPPVVTMAFSPDGRRIASAGEDRRVTVWDATTGRAVETFDGHKGGAALLAFSPNGNTLASGSTDGTVRLWDLTDRGD